VKKATLSCRNDRWREEKKKKKGGVQGVDATPRLARKGRKTEPFSRSSPPKGEDRPVSSLQVYSPKKGKEGRSALLFGKKKRGGKGLIAS